MVEKAKTSAPNGAFPWTTAIVGVPLLAIWILACALAFNYILTRVTLSVEVLQWTTWPLVVLIIGIPLTVILMFGGAELVRELLKLRQFLDNLPETVAHIERLTATIQTATRDAQDAAEVADEAASVVADSAANSGADPALLQRFNEHYNRAKNLIDQAVERHKRRSGIELQRYLKGELKTSLDTLRGANEINKAESEYIERAVYLERSTRRSGRKSLKVESLDELDEFAKQAKI